MKHNRPQRVAANKMKNDVKRCAHFSTLCGKVCDAKCERNSENEFLNDEKRDDTH